MVHLCFVNPGSGVQLKYDMDKVRRSGSSGMGSGACPRNQQRSNSLGLRILRDHGFGGQGHHFGTIFQPYLKCLRQIGPKPVYS